MSHNTNIPAFRPTAFDTVAKNFWQDYVQGNPIGGGAAYESKLRELPLDGSLESLKQLDRLLLAIKKDLNKRGYDEKMVLQQTSFRNFLLFVMFYTGRVVANELKQVGSWQPLAHMEQYYPKVAFGNSDNKFYHLAAFFPQSFLADTRIPPMFVLLTLGAKLFGSFERKFSEPLMGEIAPESLYWAATGYVQVVKNFGAVVSAPQPMSSQPLPPQTPVPQGVPSKIAQTAPTAKPMQVTAIRPDTPVSATNNQAHGSMADNRGVRPATPVGNSRLLQNAPIAPQRQVATSELPVSPPPAQPQPAAPKTPSRVIPPGLDLQSRAVQESVPSMARPVPPTPSSPLTPTQQAPMEQATPKAEPKPEPKPALSLQMRGESTRPAPPLAEYHKEHRFQAGGLAPMTLAPPVVTVKPIAPSQPTKPQTSAQTTPNVAPQHSVANQTAVPAASPVADTTKNSPNNTTAKSHAPMPQKPNATPSPKSAKSANPNDDMFSELQRDLVNLPAANSTEEVRYQQVKSVLDRYDATLAEKLARGEQEIVFTDNELSAIQRAVYNAKKLADMGNTSAMLAYAMCCFKGVAMPQDLEQGAVWVHKAADMNDIRAQKFLSRLYYQGLGVEQSIRQGEIWLEKAAQNGHPEAKKIQSQFSHIKLMKDDYQAETKKDKRYAIIFVLMGLVVIVALWALSKFILIGS